MATVREVIRPAPRFVVLRMEIPERVQHLAGQHYVIRLTAPDGYVAQRSYSIASAPADDLVEFAIERLDDGEVSGYLADVVEVGDELDVRGPIGGWFVWTGDAPAVGLGGGSGVVPLISMLRHARAVGGLERLRLAVSARTWEDLLYADELRAAGSVIALSRGDSYLDGRAPGRLTAGDVLPLVSGLVGAAGGLVGAAGADPVGADVTGFVCGSSGFAEAGSSLLVQAGLPASLIRVERFGPSAT